MFPTVCFLQAAVEPPWPGLCSQPGADLAPYHALQREMELLGAAITALKTACGSGRLADVGAATGLEAEQLGRLRTALAQGLGLTAAACARAADALACMPALGPCYGERWHWDGRLCIGCVEMMRLPLPCVASGPICLMLVGAAIWTAPLLTQLCLLARPPPLYS